MRIALLEIPSRWGERDRGVADAQRLLSEGPPPAVVLFNELALTGYVSPDGDFDVTRFAEPLDGPTLASARGLASASGATVLFPLVERDGDRHYNAFAGVAPSGDVVLHYRKRHPWFPERWATAGDGPIAELTVAGARLALAICFDVHFLSDEAADVLGRADALLFPSAWVDLGTTRDLRAPIFDTLARSFELVVANANWGPGAPRVGGQGSSRVVGPRGEIARTTSRIGVAQRLDCLL